MLKSKDMNIYQVNVRIGQDNEVFTVPAYDEEGAKQQAMYNNNIKYRDIIEVSV